MVECNWKTEGRPSKNEDLRTYCKLTKLWDCDEEDCILQQQLKLLKEIREKLKIKNNPKCMCGDYKDEHLRSGTACSKCSCREFVERK